MNAYQAKEFIYAYGMIIATLVEVEAMRAENMQRQHLGQSMAYTDKDFMDVLERNGVHHNGLVEMGRRIIEY